MWANISVTPKINNWRLKKAIMKITAFWGIESGIPLNKTLFNIKMKKIQSSDEWVFDMRNHNLSGAWSTIGTARWRDKNLDIQIPENINAL
jgi:hypothetical protein